MFKLSEILQLCVRWVACKWHVQASVPTQSCDTTCKASLDSSRGNSRSAACTSDVRSNLHAADFTQQDPVANGLALALKLISNRS